MGALTTAWAQLGAVGLLGLIVLAIVFGRLVPRRQYLDALAREQRRGDDWRDAYQAELERGRVRDEQMGEILSALRGKGAGA